MPISLVLFRSASIVDARAIVERAHSVGAYVILDCFQAAGTLPIDVRGLNVDFAVGGCLKWLCGGPGVAYLYARPDLRKKLSPMITGWSAHQRPFNFEVGPMELRDDGFRFLNGTPHIPALYACQPGLEILAKIGIERIREKSKRQTQRLIDDALARGWRVNSPRDAAERGGTVSVDCPHAMEVKTELIARNILVDYVPARACASRRISITATRKLISRWRRWKTFWRRANGRSTCSLPERRPCPDELLPCPRALDRRSLLQRGSSPSTKSRKDSRLRCEESSGCRSDSCR